MSRKHRGCSVTARHPVSTMNIKDNILTEQSENICISVMQLRLKTQSESVIESRVTAFHFLPPYSVSLLPSFLFFSFFILYISCIDGLELLASICCKGRLICYSDPKQIMQMWH